MIEFEHEVFVGDNEFQVIGTFTPGRVAVYGNAPEHNSPSEDDDIDIDEILLISRDNENEKVMVAIDTSLFYIYDHGKKRALDDFIAELAAEKVREWEGDDL